MHGPAFFLRPLEAPFAMALPMDGVEGHLVRELDFGPASSTFDAGRAEHVGEGISAEFALASCFSRC